MNEKHYLVVIAEGPMIILRVPWPMPRWRDILRASTAVMRAHGRRQKDIRSLDGLVAYPPQRDEADRDLVSRIDAAYLGAEDKVPGFWLYDWRRGAFKLARAATEVEA